LDGAGADFLSIKTPYARSRFREEKPLCDGGALQSPAGNPSQPVILAQVTHLLQKAVAENALRLQSSLKCRRCALTTISRDNCANLRAS
jgi:hypothetical protein